MKKIWKILLGITCGMLVILAGVYGYYKLCMDPYRGTVKEFAISKDMDEMLSAEDAKEDLAFLMKQMQERHPAWIDGSEELVAEVEAQYEKEVNGLKEEVSVVELYQIASRIAAKLHDGHTYVWHNDTEKYYIHDFTQIYTYGAPIAIDEIAIDKVLANFKENFSYELDFYAEHLFFSNVIINESHLRLCGIDTSDGVVMTFDNDGTEVDYTYEFVTVDKVKGREQTGEESEWVFYEIDKENSVGIFTLQSCVSNEEYRQTLDDFFAEVFAEDIQNVVVDLRGNGGGNSWVANEFIRYLDVDEYDGWDSALRFGWYLKEYKDTVYTNQKKEKIFDGNVYVLTDISTYSAAMDFAMLIADNEMGILVGQPSGNLPDSYGDCLYFEMPNSKIMVSVSYKKWSRIDKSKKGEPIMPDYEVPGEEALNKVYQLILEEK